MSALSGKRVLVTRPRAQAGELVERLSRLGALPLLFPTVEIGELEDTARLDAAIAQLEGYRWVIFTSANGVSAFCERLAALGKEVGIFGGVQVAAIGPATAQALRERGLTAAFVPDEYVAEAILPGLGEVSGKRILLPRADIARKALADELARRGAVVDEIAVYHTLPARPDAQSLRELARGVDVATFTSASTVTNFFALLGDQAQALLQGAVIACIGPVTAEAARACGLAVDVVAERYTMDGLVDALVAHLSQREGKVNR